MKLSSLNKISLIFQGDKTSSYAEFAANLKISIVES